MNIKRLLVLLVMCTLLVVGIVYLFKTINLSGNKIPLVDDGNSNSNKMSALESKSEVGKFIETPFSKSESNMGYDKYIGRVVVSGEYTYANYWGEPGSRVFCFRADKDSIEKLPQANWKTDTFCFKDIENSKKLFETASVGDFPPVPSSPNEDCRITGYATIVIESFELLTRETEGLNWATPIKVITNTNKNISCSH